MKFGGRRLLFAVGVIAAFGWPAAVLAHPSGHKDALHALHDVQYAVRQVDQAERLTLSAPEAYRRAAQRAVNVIVGRSNQHYHKKDGDGGDPVGALGRLGRLLQIASGTRAPWLPVIAGAWVNVTAAESSLEAALHADGLDEYRMDVTNALTSLDVAEGRGNELGVWGGLEGSLATTALGIPPGVVVVSGCAAPTRAPAYGVARGYLLYVSLPLDTSTLKLPEYFASNRFTLHKNMLIVYTASQKKAGVLCGKTHAVTADRSLHATPADSEIAPASDPDPSTPHLYTLAQAKQGRSIYRKYCASCHGMDLQGTAAPAVMGPEFLDTTKADGWTMTDLRYLVVNDMPRDAPGSLSPQQYAAVLAYLLAKNCYPPGNKPFPLKNQLFLARITLGPLFGTNKKYVNCSAH